MVKVTGSVSALSRPPPSQVTAVLIGILVLACSSAAPATAKPTPNIDATVEAKLAQKRAVEATVQVKVSPTLMTTAGRLPSAGLAFIH